MRVRGLDEKEVLDKINGYRQQDAKWDKVFNSICTKPLPIAANSFISGLDTNLGDIRIFKGTNKVEGVVIDILGRLFQGEGCAGNIVSGGTEANMLALYVARKLRADIKEPEILFAETVHYSILKIVEFMGFKYKTVETDAAFKMKPERLKGLISKNTVAIIATAGTSEFGSIDPIEEIAEIALKENIYLHVDAATGGFIIPFARRLGYKLPQFDFSVKGVSSITVDPHKYGLVPIPGGGIIFRDKSLQEKLKLDSYFVGTPAHTTITGTRPGAPVLATYAVLENLGIEGFMQITRKNYDNTEFLVDELDKRGYELVLKPELNIINFKTKNALDLMQCMEKMGIIISMSKRLDNVIRIVINNHISKDMVKDFINNLDLIKKNGGF